MSWKMLQNIFLCFKNMKNNLVNNKKNYKKNKNQMNNTEK